jgi:hypothetical protein
MFVELGNSQPKEGYRSEGSDEVKYRNVEGDQITTLYFPEGTGVKEAFDNTVATLGYHFQDDAFPVWVHSDSPGLKSLLEEQFSVPKQKPDTWGNYKADETPGVVSAAATVKKGE